MPRASHQHTTVLFFLLLFCGTLCSAMIIPFMGFFLVDGLGYAPWIISAYSAPAVAITVFTNRRFARHIDRGGRIFPLIGLAAAGYLCAATTLYLFPTLWAALSFGILGFGLSSSAVSTMFSLGGNLAQQQNIMRSRFNAYMRATTSTAWMIGPALTFVLADMVSLNAVFATGAATCAIWLLLWWFTLPRTITAPAEPKAAASADSLPLILAACFIFCLSSAHSLTFSALPLFYVQEVGLPGFAPGLAFSIKTAVEVGAIFSTPALIARFGLRPALIATTALAVVTIQLLAAVETLPQMFFAAALEGLYYGLYASLGISFIQSFATDRPAAATALYWNTLMISGLLAGPVVGMVAQSHSFTAVLQLASGVALFALGVLLINRRRQLA
ncbi:MFS transporter [Epibacterium sp. SM1969]|uniref:MFS transporter n=1 Tax=Tritonibacter aquimaris TaxID=2663379 RepID=A0A844ASV0_9RHOB|nr:MFS transporter [Tritonibacter aquimaris]MQY44193.1 MFS transporter [Tritonibacter aquimaris]